MTIVKQSVVLANADANVITPQISRSISSEKKYQRSKAQILQEDNIITCYVTLQHNAALWVCHVFVIKTLLNSKHVLALSHLAMLNAQRTCMITQIHIQ